MPATLPATVFALVCLMAAMPAWASSCPALEAEAAAVLALRDDNPVQGLARGEAALAEVAMLDQACAIGEALLLSAIGANLHILGRNPESVEHHRRALERLPSDAGPSQIAAVHRGAGVALVDSESYELALSHYLIALAASRDGGDTLEAAKTAGNIGNLYSTLGQLERARSYHQEALRDFAAVGFRQGTAGTLINLGALAAKFALDAQASGDSERERRENERLRDYNLEALAIFTELGNDRGVAYAESNIGLALERLGDPERALVHHQRGLALRERIGDANGRINSHVTMTSALIRLGRYDVAQQQLDQAEGLLTQGNHGLAATIANQRVELAEARGDFRDALHWQREVTRLNAELANDEHNSRVAELQERFDSDQRLREIDLLRSNAIVNDMQLQRRTLLLAVSLILGALLAILFVVLYSRFRLGRLTARELQSMARTDAVTGLANRRHMTERIEHEKLRSRRSGRPFTLLMVDIDRFKVINDRYGHGIGDAVLVEVAQRMQAEVRGQDMLARWGGEEFLVVLPDTDMIGACVVAEKLRLAVSSVPMAIPDQDLPIALSVTIGVAECTPDVSIDDCVKVADEAMYVGKRGGRDQVVAASA